MTNNVRFTYSVDDTTHAVLNQYRARQIELVMLNTIFSVVGTLGYNFDLVWSTLSMWTLNGRFELYAYFL